MNPLKQGLKQNPLTGKPFRPNLHLSMNPLKQGLKRGLDDTQDLCGGGIYP